MTELYYVWTIINVLLILAGLWLMRKAEKMLDEAKSYLDQDEKLYNEMKETISEWERNLDNG